MLTLRTEPLHSASESPDFPAERKHAWPRRTSHSRGHITTTGEPWTKSHLFFEGFYSGTQSPQL